MILMPLLMSCQSLKTDSNVVKFPPPYDSEGNQIVTYNADADMVSMPLWYWKKIVRFAVDVKGVKE